MFQHDGGKLNVFHADIYLMPSIRVAVLEF